jgi:hypothetical protein
MAAGECEVGLGTDELPSSQSESSESQLRPSRTLRGSPFWVVR